MDQSPPDRCWTGRETGLSCAAPLAQIPLTLPINHQLFVSIFHPTSGWVGCQFTLPVSELFLFKLHDVKAVSKPLTHLNSDPQQRRCKGKSWTNTAIWLPPGQAVHRPNYLCEPRCGKQDILPIWESKISHEKSWEKPSKLVWPR